jgi:hypothetical protein
MSDVRNPRSHSMILRATTSGPIELQEIARAEQLEEQLEKDKLKRDAEMLAMYKMYFGDLPDTDTYEDPEAYAAAKQRLVVARANEVAAREKRDRLRAQHKIQFGELPGWCDMD